MGEILTGYRSTLFYRKSSFSLLNADDLLPLTLKTETSTDIQSLITIRKRNMNMINTTGLLTYSTWS